MLESFSASGFLVHTPCGPRKSGMPDSVEMPAPVNTTAWRACATQDLTSATNTADDKAPSSVVMNETRELGGEIALPDFTSGKPRHAFVRCRTGPGSRI